MIEPTETVRWHVESRSFGGWQWWPENYCDTPEEAHERAAFFRKWNEGKEYQVVKVTTKREVQS